jgi:hypothetical protein
VNAAFLHNGNGTGKRINSFDKFDIKPSALNLMPTKWNVVATCAKDFTPFMHGNLNVIFAPGTNMLILFPSVQYSVSERIDADLFGNPFFRKRRVVLVIMPIWCSSALTHIAAIQKKFEVFQGFVCF